MTDTQVKCFLELAKYLNYTKTAKSLGISQSTLSAHIIALESSLGIRLLRRSKRTVELSEEGQIMRAAFERMMPILEQAQNEAKKINAVSELNVGIMEGGNHRLFPSEKKEEFDLLHPDIRLQISGCSQSERLRLLDEGKFDAIFGYHQLLKYRKDLSGITVLRTPLYLVKPQWMADVYLLEHMDLLRKQRFFLVNQIEEPMLAFFIDQFLEQMHCSKEQIQYVMSRSSADMNISLGLGVGVADETSIIFGAESYSFEKIPDTEMTYDLIYKSTNCKHALLSLLDYFQQHLV